MSTKSGTTGGKLTKYERLKLDILYAYGRVCKCCGETEPVFLTIDHIAGDGAHHRRATKKRGGYNTYRWLKSHNYPKGFQVLCWNCNCAKRTKDACPHESIRKRRGHAEKASR